MKYWLVDEGKYIDIPKKNTDFKIWHYLPFGVVISLIIFLAVGVIFGE